MFGLMWQPSKCAESQVITYFRISYFGHASPKLNLVLISRAIQNVKDLRNSSLWTC